MEEKDPQNTQKSNDNLHPKLVSRSAVLLGFAALLFSALLIRILLLQTVDYSHYRQKVLEQMTTESRVSASRGNLYDANGAILAKNVSTYRVFISPSTIARAQSEHNKNGSNIRLDTLISEHLAAILNVDYAFVMKQMTYTNVLDRTIERGVDKDRAEDVRAFIAEYGLEQMIYLESTHTRYYPYSDLASHTLGFTGSDGTGLYGLEYYYDKMLAGTDGRYVTARDAQGREMPYSYKEYIAAQNGYNVHTTLDVYVQSVLEEELSTAYIESGGANRAAGIVMNVHTGEILGMAVYPDFDLNAPRTLDAQSQTILNESGFAAGSDEYAKLKQELQQTMWGNKAITESYIPGSTFKVITAAMAVEEDIDTIKGSYTCTGAYRVSDRTIHCHKTHGHGTLTFAEGIQQSCNPWLMRLGQGLGKVTFYQYLRAFGYLEKTGIDLPGEGGSLFATEEKFTDLDLAIYAFGQNFNVTLIQQITAISAVANGGYLVKPHLVSSITDENGNLIFSYDAASRRQVVSEETCKTVSDILEKGVSGNGGAKNAYVAGYRIAAKTGTSEKKDAGSLGQYVCSTVAYAPADNPQYAVIIIVDEPTKGVLYGSTVAAPYVGNVMEAILPYLGVEAIYSDAELEKMTVTVPNVTTWSVSAAKKAYEKNGFTVDVIGDPDGVIRRQYPEAGTVVEKSAARIIVYTDKESEEPMVRVPDLIGSGTTALAANKILTDAGLNIRITGTKNYMSGTGPKVIAQSIAPGTMVPRGTVVEVTFRYEEDDDYDESWTPTLPEELGT